MARSEQWRPVRGWEGLYDVSSLGRVRSTPGRVAHYLRLGKSFERPVPSKILTPYVDADDYDRVKFSRPGDGGNVIHRPKVHVIVCEAFHGPRPGGAHAAHGDDNRRNNRLANLRWASPTENCSDSRRNGRMPIGERSGTAKITAEQAQAIQASTLSARALGRMFGISAGHAWRIKVAKRWGHLVK